MTIPIIIRKAKPDDAKDLSQLSLRSKAYWGYSIEFLQNCAKELTVTFGDIENLKNQYEVALLNNKIIGFYALSELRGHEIELMSLFDEPIFIKKGVGRKLMDNAKNHAIKLGAQKVVIQGDPNAEKFYLSVGGQIAGDKESTSIPGRYLPIFHIQLFSLP